MCAICSFSSFDDLNKCYEFMKDQALVTGYVTKYNLNEFLGIEPTTDEKYIGWLKDDVLNAYFTYDPNHDEHILQISEPESLVNLNDNILLHSIICKELADLYERKNHDYGDAFHDTFIEEGFSMARIRV